MSTTTLQQEFFKLANKEQAKILQRFFKTGKGQYGEGDIFLGIKVPQIRKLVTKYQMLSIEESLRFLKSKYHEQRLFALLLLVRKFQKVTEQEQEKIYKIYLNHMAYINNWDLVDLSAEHIIGAFIFNKPKNILKKLAKSNDLWQRRIAILSTFNFIKNGHSDETLTIAALLLKDKHDLIHKAVGWMLREVGKRCSLKKEEEFLQEHIKTMPRTMLRYAIEKFPEEKRQYYLKAK
ncbi:DNA alkylation repair protein [Candidatus Uhrbacteria bacterium CG_4_9_14_3_um_filter_36_7]|uniref:DNA alkylation repair protein n=1 Tax=Candidatus Uhrbacteria bacterium CG_4_9_14_3_um_filter_36_7 TaxID=1975033 RepID=A0A2M7XFV4_9BACT|nr:MAG: DNA alkylation repair protein [Candidatus Uhrbacteria bacterium CG_4_9_14_3_um_filter_36_7]